MDEWMLLKPQSVIYADVMGAIFKNNPVFCSCRGKEGGQERKLKGDKETHEIGDNK